MRAEHEIPTGELSRRMTGAIRRLRTAAINARTSAWSAELAGSGAYAASLRGKATAYYEAEQLLIALDRGRDLPLRRFGREVFCHCGEPVVYGYDGDPTHHRGMCQLCDSVRCDAYPDVCNQDVPA